MSGWRIVQDTGYGALGRGDACELTTFCACASLWRQPTSLAMTHMRCLSADPGSLQQWNPWQSTETLVDFIYFVDGSLNFPCVQKTKQLLLIDCALTHVSLETRGRSIAEAPHVPFFFFPHGQTGYLQPWRSFVDVIIQGRLRAKSCNVSQRLPSTNSPTCGL